MNLPDLSLVLTCDNLVVEASSRRTIKQLFDACSFYETLQLQRHSDIRLLTENHHIHWPATSYMLNFNTTEQDKASTSFKQHQQRSFKYKLFTCELPTLVTLKQRRPDLYALDTCLSCQQATETQDHIWLCQHNQAQWRSILSNAADCCLSLLKQLNTKTLPTKDTVHQLMHESRTFFTKGIVPNRLFELIHNVARSIPTSYHLIAQVYNLIYSQVFNLIWKPRCEKVITQEQALGITNCNKRTKHKPRQRPKGTTVNSSRLRIPIARPEVQPLVPWVKWFTASIRQGDS